MSARGHQADTPVRAVSYTTTPASLIVLAIGCVAMAVALVLVIAGVPAAMFYDIDGPGVRNRNDSHDMLKMSSSIDRNIKYIKDGTDDDPDSYNGYELSISKSEDAIPKLAEGVRSLSGAVNSLDQSLKGVADTTVAMRKDIASINKASAHSLGSMQSLKTDIGVLSESMAAMYDETSKLTKSMGNIERSARNIAKKRTSKARQLTEELNGVLPESVPEPQKTLEPDTVVAP